MRSRQKNLNHDKLNKTKLQPRNTNYQNIKSFIKLIEYFSIKKNNLDVTKTSDVHKIDRLP